MGKDHKGYSSGENNQAAKTMSIFHEPLVSGNHGSYIRIYVNSDKRQGWKIAAATAVVTTIAVVGAVKWYQKKQK
ncbi:MAG: hypothetical protein ACRCWD_04450 [Culicoidibacterales bacterium]